MLGGGDWAGRRARRAHGRALAGWEGGRRVQPRGRHQPMMTMHEHPHRADFAVVAVVVMRDAEMRCRDVERSDGAQLVFVCSYALTDLLTYLFGGL